MAERRHALAAVMSQVGIFNTTILLNMERSPASEKSCYQPLNYGLKVSQTQKAVVTLLTNCGKGLQIPNFKRIVPVYINVGLVFLVSSIASISHNILTQLMFNT